MAAVDGEHASSDTTSASADELSVGRVPSKRWYLALVDPLLDEGVIYWELNKETFTVGFFEGYKPSSVNYLSLPLSLSLPSQHTETFQKRRQKLNCTKRSEAYGQIHSSGGRR
jgi:hypothetical protein